MATTITAGNATNGAAISSDNTGILELKTGTGAGTTALTLNASQNATLAGTLQVAGVTTSLYPLVSSTAKTAVTDFTTSADFTGIPSWAKRITVMFSGISLNGSDNIIIQIGSGSISTSGYASSAAFTGTSSGGGTSTAGFVVTNAPVASSTFSGSATIVNISGNTWISTGSLIYESTTPTPFVILSTGIRSLSGVLDRVSVTRTGTNTFDAGTVNIMWE